MKMLKDSNIAAIGYLWEAEISDLEKYVHMAERLMMIQKQKYYLEKESMESKEGIAIIKHIIALCHEIGKKCIAEGVETKEQEQILFDLKCDYYQGYLLDWPIPVNTFEKYIDK